jgi:cardiolipin synthase
MCVILVLKLGEWGKDAVQSVMSFCQSIPWWAIGTVFHLASFVLVVCHCLCSRREATSALLWIFVAWSFPFFGPLFYLSFGVNRLPAKGWVKAVHDRRFLEARRKQEQAEFPLAYWRAMYDMVKTEPADAFSRGLDRAMDAIVGDFPLLNGNRIEPLVGESEAYPAMLAAIRDAKHHIHLQTFIFSDDAVGREFMQALATKAREGVEVRVLYDRFGSTFAQFSGLFRRYRRIPNMQIVGWTQANPLKRQFQINLRNHRKALVVDGCVAFLGGMNINTQQTRSGAVRDYHFRACGPVVLELQYTFMRDWDFMTGEGADRCLKECYFRHQDAAGSTAVRLLNSGPTDEMGAIADVIFMAITSAQHEVLIATAYFVPTRAILEALRTAALRGVNVRLIVPRRSNHIYAGMAGQALYVELLAAGVRIFRRKPPFMHAKACVVDDTFVLVGTANMDVRSLRLNYETNLAIHDCDFAEVMKRILLDEVNQSDEIVESEWNHRSPLKRFAENLAALLMPVL